MTERKLVALTGFKPDTAKNVIELSGVSKSYFTSDVETKVLNGIDLKIRFGDFVAILGPSGSGKTTLLNIISGLDVADAGDVVVLGYNLSLLKDAQLTKFRRDHIGFIFQQYNLLSNLTAKENVEVGAYLCPKQSRNRYQIKEIFQVIEMLQHMNKYPHQMSGGEQQRVAIARALAKAPTILFGDEPTGALDEKMGRKVLSILKEINRRYHTTFIIVTHDLAIASTCNTIIHVKNGQIEKQEHNPHPVSPANIF